MVKQPMELLIASAGRRFRPDNATPAKSLLPHCWTRRLASIACFTLLCGLGWSKLDTTQAQLFGQTAAPPPTTPAVPPPDANPKPNDRSLPLDAATERQVLAMVDQHLPDLKGMLDYLRSHAPEEYQQALRDLARRARRLKLALRRGERFYETELQTLKVENRIDLAVAKLRLKDEPSLRVQLRGDLRELQQLRTERLLLERDAIEQRVERATEQLAAAEKRLLESRRAGDAAAERAYENLVRKISLQKPGRQKTVDRTIDTEIDKKVDNNPAKASPKKPRQSGSPPL